jgi:arabinose 5-phosphate isomerase
MTGKSTSPLALAAKAVLDIAVEREACPMHLAPDLQHRQHPDAGRRAGDGGDAGARFNEEDFARSHPAGALGARLLNKVHHLMRRDDEVPRVNDTSVMDAMLELSRTGLGLVAVCDEPTACRASSPTATCAAGWWAAARSTMASARR